MIFADSVAYPFRIGFAEVYRRFAEAGLTDDVVFIGAGKLGIPENAVVAFALGVDMVNAGREAMMSIGCIQAQKCHTDHCPVGVATQNPRYTRGLDVSLKSVRAANYVRSLRRDLLKVSEAIGVVHPGLISPRDVDFVDRHPVDDRPGRDLRLRPRRGRGSGPTWSARSRRSWSRRTPPTTSRRRPAPDGRCGRSAGARAAYGLVVVLGQRAERVEEVARPLGHVVGHDLSCASPASGGRSPCSSAAKASSSEAFIPSMS